VAESVFLTVMAGYIGLSLGVGILELLNQILISSQKSGDELFFRNPEINLTMALAALAVLVIAGIIAGLIPASRAIKIKPIDALRDEK
jgi:putative ABC transport system permease protein